MPGHVKVGGSWKSVATPSVKVGGSWKAVDAGYTKVAGAWKQWYTAAPPAAMELIETAVATGFQSNITFSSIPQDYKHLEIRFVSRSTQATTNAGIDIRLNNDSGSNYWNHLLEGTGTSVVSENYGPSVSAFAQTAGTSIANAWPASVLQILDYTSTGKNKTLRNLNGWSSVEIPRIRLLSALWNNTSAVTTVSVSLGSGNFVAGSRFSLYGIKG